MKAQLFERISLKILAKYYDKIFASRQIYVILIKYN